MCGLFGFTCYGGELPRARELVSALAVASAERGTDATGIAWMGKRGLEIQKEAKSAARMSFRLPDKAKAVMGHTRHSTQGSEKVWANNHPFWGRLKNRRRFALAHNGVLVNDTLLRREHRLPKTKIRTDSYIAVQLIEQKGELSMSSLGYMAEQVRGSFSFSVMDDGGNLYLVKGESPLSVLHLKGIETYCYASTDRILWRGLVDSPVLSYLKGNGEVEEISVESGQVLYIGSGGELAYGEFAYDPYMVWEYPRWDSFRMLGAGNVQADEYLRDLQDVASGLGYDADTVCELYKAGHSCLEIEEMLYEL